MTRRQDGRWQEEMTFIVRGQKKRKFFYGKTKADVMRKIREYTAEVEHGRTFEVVAAEWWNEAQKTLAYNTQKGYKPALNRATAYFGYKFIREIYPTEISRFLRDMIRDHGMADKTARTQLMVVNLICKYAVASGDLDSNPARDLTVPKNLSKSKRDIASDADIQAVKTSTGCTFGMFAFWIMYTGCRRGELMALRWEDVDLARRNISISKSVYHINNIPYVKEPKTAAGRRIVPLMNKLYDAIEPKTGLIFPDPQTGGLMTEAHFARLWDQYQRESGCSCTPHQLRHAYATMLFENDVSESDAQELLGHAQISTTKDIYTHIRESRKQKIRAQLLDADIG